jgi:hypothetical protein
MITTAWLETREIPTLSVGIFIKSRVPKYVKGEKYKTYMISTDFKEN